jgi:hypothetical protein
LWAALADQLDQRLLQQGDWPALAQLMQEIDDQGHDVAALTRAATKTPLNDHPAQDLRYRLAAHLDLGDDLHGPRSTPHERLLAIFDPLESDDATVLRGCPFHNAAVDAAGEMPHVAQLVKQHKQAFLDRLISTAVEAGAPDPVSLGRQLAVVYEGAAALSASSNTTQVVPDARRAAETLIQVALNQP